MKKQNQKKNSAIVSMTKSTFIKEHKSLIPILRKGTKKQRIKEANDQARHNR